ncbi:MAG: hypothetical protein IT528_05625, partial [Nitrosomonas sp.]|nr:hypothetical protein [Nitrosomonas sp.]
QRVPVLPVPLAQLIKRVVLPPPQPRSMSRCKCCDGVMKIVRTQPAGLGRLGRTRPAKG